MRTYNIDCRYHDTPNVRFNFPYLASPLKSNYLPLHFSEEIILFFFPFMLEKSNRKTTNKNFRAKIVLNKIKTNVLKPQTIKYKEKNEYKVYELG